MRSRRAFHQMTHQAIARPAYANAKTTLIVLAFPIVRAIQAIAIADQNHRCHVTLWRLAALVSSSWPGTR